MENPYWHPEQKRHVISTDDVRRLAFEAFNIVHASMSMMGQGLGEEGEEDSAPTSLEDLHYRLAESELSSRLLRLAVLMRTLDDYWSDAGHGDYAKAINKVNQETDFGQTTKGKSESPLTFREALNKIIHAEDVRPVYDTDDDREAANARWGMDGQLELSGIQGKEKWDAAVNLFQFLEAVVDVLDVVDELQP